MHPLIGLAILIGAAVFVAFRQSTRVPRSGRRDDGAVWPLAGSEGGPSHHGDSGAFGHG